MSGFTIINYQGSKNNLDNFIYSNIEKYLPSGKTILDIFCGAGSVSNIFRTTHKVFANDVETYSYMIVDSILNQPDYTAEPNFFDSFSKKYNRVSKQLSTPIIEDIKKEQTFLTNLDADSLIKLYHNYPTVWNNKKSPITNSSLSVEALRKEKGYYLFSTYFAGSYFGIEQALEIDAIIKCIHSQKKQFHNSLLHL